MSHELPNNESDSLQTAQGQLNNSADTETKALLHYYEAQRVRGLGTFCIEQVDAAGLDKIVALLQVSFRPEGSRTFVPVQAVYAPALVTQRTHSFFEKMEILLTAPNREGDSGMARLLRERAAKKQMEQDYGKPYRIIQREKAIQERSQLTHMTGAYAATQKISTGITPFPRMICPPVRAGWKAPYFIEGKASRTLLDTFEILEAIEVSSRKKRLCAAIILASVEDAMRALAAMNVYPIDNHDGNYLVSIDNLLVTRVDFGQPPVPEETDHARTLADTWDEFISGLEKHALEYSLTAVTLRTLQKNNPQSAQQLLDRELRDNGLTRDDLRVYRRKLAQDVQDAQLKQQLAALTHHRKKKPPEWTAETIVQIREAATNLIAKSPTVKIAL